MKPQRILAIHDLSCFGRCSLMVIIPALSAMGMEVVPLPTALLSTHTGGFCGMTFYDLTHTMLPALEHYRQMDMSFDAIYTGFLGSAPQIDTVRTAIEMFGHSSACKDRPLILVDPVMGDDGEVYQTYTPEMCHRMGELCHLADILTPNLTEACILTDEAYPAPFASRDAAESTGRRLALALAERYKVGRIALTGIEWDDRLLSISLDYGELTVIEQPRLASGYPGTGDLFASILLGEAMENQPFCRAVENACRLTADFIADTARTDSPRREGLCLEPNLYRLTERRNPQ